MQEIAKLAADVSQAGLGLVIFADWYHEDTVRKLRFFDDNTRSWWDAATGEPPQHTAATQLPHAPLAVCSRASGSLGYGARVSPGSLHPDACRA